MDDLTDKLKYAVDSIVIDITSLAPFFSATDGSAFISSHAWSGIVIENVQYAL